MSISENPAACKVKKFCKALSELQLEKDYDITLNLYIYGFDLFIALELYSVK